jgi:hypothetical protein
VSTREYLVRQVADARILEQAAVDVENRIRRLLEPALPHVFGSLFVHLSFSRPRGEHSRNTVHIDIASCTLAAAIVQHAACCALHAACCCVASPAVVLQLHFCVASCAVVLQAVLLCCKLRCCVASPVAVVQAALLCCSPVLVLQAALL